MTPNDDVINVGNMSMMSGFSGLGSFERVEKAFAQGGQVIGSGGLGSSVENLTTVKSNKYIASVQINFSFETRWRPISSFDEYTYDFSNNFMVSGISISNGSSHYAIYVGASYKQGNLSVITQAANRRNTAANANVPSYTLTVRALAYTAPFKT